MPEINRAFPTFSEKEVAELLKIPKKTLVLYHARPDGDTIGCALALAGTLKALGSDARIAGSDEIPERLSFLCPEDVTTGLYENVIADFTPERIVSVDAADIDLLGRVRTFVEGKVDIMIDHHELGRAYAPNLIDPKAAACGQIVMNIIFDMFDDKASIPMYVLNCCYAAIASDTGCFKYSNVTSETHRLAALLISMGVDTANINTLLFDTKSEKQLRAEALAASRVSLHYNGQVSVVSFPYSLKEENGLSEEHLETIVDIARCISGVMVAIAVKQPNNDDKYRISLRSNCGIDVSRVCAAFGGGGHKKAAGCTITASSDKEAYGKVLEFLGQYF